jgi:hypothetical protein
MSTNTVAAPAAIGSRRPLGAYLLLAGGLAWVAKVAVIVATSGAEDEEAITSTLYIAAVVLMLAGAAGLAWSLSHGRHVALRIGAAVLGASCVVAGYVVIDSAVPEFGAAWFRDEIGILVTGLVAACICVWGLRLAARRA